MFEVDTYLRRLGYSGPREATLATLRKLHRAHLLAIPYDNTRFPEDGGALPDNLADLDHDLTFDKIVVRGAGGICFELNLLFQRLLDEIGFETIQVSAGVHQGRGTFSPALSHRFTVVSLDDVRWLADVGFAGPAYLLPLELSPAVQTQYGCQFRVTENDGLHTVLRRSRSTDWHPLYCFELDARKTSDWDGFTKQFERYLDDAVIANTTMLCRADERGHRALVGRRYLTVEDGQETVITLTDPREYQRVVCDLSHSIDGTFYDAAPNTCCP
ncbi:acetyltransferase [Amycolatopsis orientalis]|uniref:Acetyltransferase n=1 Tax=Amycolatopsis orientalis TaxID=31958 RepID=A0A193BV84_AMYOR|nr:arylamine N-acetyltransferase [Amycolatopsis orientalis]ANN16083.1 acetyltransferase [Amycolatopsis orientalis]